MEAEQIFEQMLDQEVDLMALYAAETIEKKHLAFIKVLRQLVDEVGHLATFQEIMGHLPQLTALQQLNKKKRDAEYSKILQYFVEYSLRKMSAKTKQDIYQILAKLNIQVKNIVLAFKEAIVDTTRPSALTPAQSLQPVSNQAHEFPTNPEHNASHGPGDPTRTTVDFPVLPEA